MISLILAAAMALSLCGCGGGSRGTDVLEVPAWVMERKGTGRAGSEDVASTVNFYYDNTVSMYPFVCNEKGKSEVNGKPVVTGTLVHWMNAVRQILQQFGGVTYTLQANEKKELRWQPYDNGDQEDFRNNFGNRKFYTGDDVFPMDGDAEVGPLAQLYYPFNEKSFDPAATNIVLTDLAEQSVNNTELAAHINRDILSQEGYAAAVIAVKCPFHGMAYVPNPDKISQLKKGKVDGLRPLYMILTGPEERLKMVYDSMLQAMQNYGLSVDEDYYTTIQSAKETVNAVKNDDIMIPPTLAENDKKSFRKYVDNSEFSDNLGLNLLDESEEANLFGSESYLNVDLNVFDYVKASGSDRMVLNYYIPLPDYSENYLWRLAKDKDADLRELVRQSDVELMQKKDYLTYDYITLEDIEVDLESDTSDAEEQERQEEKGEKQEKKRRRRSRSKKQRQTVASWYNRADGQWTTLKNFEDSFTVEAKLLGPDDITEDMTKGAKLYDSKGKYVSSSGEGERGSRGYELDESDEIDFSASDYWIQLKVENNTSTFDGPVVAFDLPVYAYIIKDKQMPGWVESLNVTAKDVSSSKYYNHTFNLSGFYSTLFGVNVQGDEKQYQNECEVKIADIVTVINNLPTSKKSR